MSVLSVITMSGFSAYFVAKNGTVALRYPEIPLSDRPLAMKAGEMFSRLEGMGYSPSTIKGDQWLCNKILKEVGEGDRLVYYSGLFSRFSVPGKKPELSILRRWMLFDLFDVLPADGQARDYTKDDRINNLSEYYLNKLKDFYDTSSISRKQTTVAAESRTLRRFFVYLDGSGIKNLSEITDKIVREYKVYADVDIFLLARIGKMFERCGFEGASLFPKACGHRKRIYECLTQEDTQAFKTIIHSSEITALHRSVGMLATYNGIRGCDIKYLKKDDIDWERKEIIFAQEKTGRMVSSPLLPPVENAILDYLQNERPQSELPYVFINPTGHRGKNTQIDPYSIIRDVYTKCGIRTGSERKGVHLLRHSMATELMRQGNDLSLIAETLGHARPETSLVYLSADIESLRRTALSINQFPVNARVYNDKHEKDE